MADSPLRPRGTVEITCSEPGCGWALWLPPDDPRLPGPVKCDINHEAQRFMDALSAILAESGLSLGIYYPAPTCYRDPRRGGCGVVSGERGHVFVAWSSESALIALTVRDDFEWTTFQAAMAAFETHAKEIANEHVMDCRE